jgi:two-component system phosphate regulon sensor histidine kinase PhoR
VQDAAFPSGTASSQSCGVSVLDAQHRILWCNALSAAHLGIQTRTDIGEPIASILRGSPLVDYLAAGDFSRPLRLRSAGQESRILSTWLVPYLEFRWLLLTLDITQAVELEVTRRNFVADALHEMSAPITVLAGYLDAMRGFAFGPKRLRDYLDSMEQQCQRLRRTAESLVNLSTLESAPEPPGDERIDLRMLCAEIRAVAEALSAGRHGIVLDARPEIDLFGCGSEITSAFSNLASNAVRYTPPGGEIRLILRALPDGSAEFAVEDNGIGIALEHIPRLTERFFRVDHELSRKAAGTGIGLAIVKDVLARHQATLEIESEPGRGSRFAARFPAYRVKPAAAISATMDDCGSRVYPAIRGRIPLKVAGGRTPAPELRSAPSQAYGRVFATTQGKPRRRH